MEFVKNTNRFFRLQTWNQPSPGASQSPPPTTAPSVSDKTPSTMSYHHGPAAHPMVAQHVTHESHPHNPGQVFSHRDGPHASLLRRDILPKTQHESLIPADPRENKSFWRGVLDRAKRALGVEE
jgi:hypothetical protein